MRTRLVSDSPTCCPDQVVPASPDARLESHDSAELLIPEPETPSEVVPLPEEFEVDETLHVVVPTDGHLSGRRSWTEVRNAPMSLQG